MIQITSGTMEERILKVLQKIYPITVSDLEKELHLSEKMILRVLKKLQTKGIVKLDQLPDKIFIRLLRQDFSFIGKKHQRKFIKHTSEKRTQESKEYDGIMFH